MFQLFAALTPTPLSLREQYLSLREQYLSLRELFQSPAADFALQEMEHLNIPLTSTNPLYIHHSRYPVRKSP